MPDIKFLLPIIILSLILTLTALIDVIRRDEREIKGKKLYWIPIILLFQTVGPLAYLLVGKKH